MTDHSTTDQPAHYADRKVEVIDTIREALVPDDFQGYCCGKALELLLDPECSSEDMRKAANYARWASGEEWRPGRLSERAERHAEQLREGTEDRRAAIRHKLAECPHADDRECDFDHCDKCAQLTDPAEPAACIECGNGECEDIASGYCCKCYADEYGGNAWCHHCAGLLPEAPSVAETPPQVADILGRPVTISTRSKGCCASVTLEGGTVHMYWGESAEDAWGLLARSLGCDE